MEIVSSQSDEWPSSLSDLFAIDGKVQSVIAISAYTDLKSIEQLIKFVKDNADLRGKAALRIYMDKSSSRFYSDETINDELIKLQNKIEKLFRVGSGIFLVKYGQLFHTKLYLVEGNHGGKILFGSMNLTQNGLNSNEEILCIGDYAIDGNSYASKIASWAKEYMESLEKIATLVSDEIKGNYPSCIRQFLLNGSVYYERKEQNPFRFKLNLPEEIIKQNVDIDQLLESNITDSISLESLILSSHIENDLNYEVIYKKHTRSYWKRYCIETCYGFWSPDILRDKLDSDLNSRKKDRKPYYDKMKSIIENNEVEIRTAFLSLCSRIQMKLLDMPEVPEWKYGQEVVARKAWDKWYRNLHDKIKNTQFYNRLILGISSAPVPDVWNDPVSSVEFESSFMDSIIYHWSKEHSKATANIIARNIYLNLSPKEGMHEDTLKKAIEKWLSDPKKNAKSLVCFDEDSV